MDLEAYFKIIEQLDTILVRRAIQIIESYLGKPDPKTTKKMVRWLSYDINVNVCRESKRHVTIYIHSKSVVRSGIIKPNGINTALPPKNSNCSHLIREGPTLIIHAACDDDFELLNNTLSEIYKGGSTVSYIEPEFYESADEEVQSLEIPTGERRLATQPLDLTIADLVARITRQAIILQPEFQREYVWSSAKASLLIESLLMRIPLPIVYLSETPDEQWEVVDGQQRLTSIHSYVTERFPDGGDFKLGKLAVRTDLRGKHFSDLSKVDQNAILNYSLRAVVLQKESHADLKFEVFERLNCGSVQLTDAELRNCMYRGSYNDMLAELSENAFLLKVRKATSTHKRMEDRQLILRFLAMKRTSHLNFRGSMKSFMNNEIRHNRQAAPAQTTEMKRWFTDAIESAWTVFGENAFRRWTPSADGQKGGWDNKLNIALWDTLLYSFAFYEKRQIVQAADAIREEFLDLMASDPKFVDCIGRSTDRPDRLQYRADVWRKRLESVIEVPANEKRGFSRKLKGELYAADPSCLICNQQIPSVDDAEVDHVDHYWRGGPTIPANARLLHRHCNRVRGGRTDDTVTV